MPANGSVEVRFPFFAARTGDAKFTFTAKGGAEGDSVQVTRKIETPLSLEAVALYGETKSAVGEKLGDLKAMRDDVGGLDIKVASSALVGLDDGVDQLLDYPYGCTEQLTSRMVPFVAAASLGTDGSIQLPKNLPSIVNDAIGKIVKNQLDDGGFGFWIDSPRSIPWLTAYALWDCMPRACAVIRCRPTSWRMRDRICIATSCARDRSNGSSPKRRSSSTCSQTSARPTQVR